MEAGYLKLFRSGELIKRVGRAYACIRSCRLCPRDCGVNRLRGQNGVCRTGKLALIASANIHNGEEPPISGSRGSGTIFFASCNMRCVFCQNYPISQMRHGKEATPFDLANMMIRLQNDGCHNINLVTASHVVPQFIAGLYIAAGMGLHIPIVYNSGGYDGMKSLQLLGGIIDIYMSDIKYSDPRMAEKYSGAPNYVKFNRIALKEMYRQVGDLKMDDNGIAVRGLLVRHLVLPENISGTRGSMNFVANEISPKTYISLMSQYFPAYTAPESEILKRKITGPEFQDAVDAFHDSGLENGWIQEIPS